MPEREPIATTNLDIYGSEAIPWSRPLAHLKAIAPESDILFVLSTTRPDGRPHAAGIGALWLDGDLYFTSGPGTRKSRNLAENPNAAITVRLPDIVLTLEGEARRTTDPALLEAAAARYREGGWPAEVAGDALSAPYSAPSAGPPPWLLYRFVVHTANGVAFKEPYGATRWRFAD